MRWDVFQRSFNSSTRRALAVNNGNLRQSRIRTLPSMINDRKCACNTICCVGFTYLLILCKLTVSAEALQEWKNPVATIIWFGKLNAA